MPNVLLVSMPWADVSRPSLGISLLKAILARDGVAADIAYLCFRWSEMLRQHLGRATFPDDGSLDLHGLHDQTRIARWAQRELADEWLFSQCLFGHGSLDAERYVRDALRPRLSPAQLDRWLGLRGLAERFLDDCLSSIAWGDCALVGFTSMGRQHLASLCLAQRLKARWPRLRVAFGGPNCEGPMGAALMRRFPFVDYAADGEADLSFPALVRALLAGERPTGIKGILWRDGERVVSNGPPDPLRDLDALPCPDFDDYFAQLAACSFRDALDVRLPLEHSRGCWWAERGACTFCALHGPAAEFRAKSPRRTLAEFDALVRRHPVSRVSFMDNVLHPRRAAPVLAALGERRGGEASLFFEIRSTIRKADLRALRRAGAWAVQPGIESFSTRLLRLMHKGVTALHNVRCLKWCHQYGIRPGWNLLYGFPGERPADYAAMLPILRAITHLARPNRVERVRLYRFSRDFCEAQRRGFARARPPVGYRFVYPFPERDLCDLAYQFDYDYADGHDPEACAAEVKAFVGEWREHPRGELIHFRLDAGRGRILDSRFNRVVEALDLDPFENDLYERCDAIRSVASLSGFLSRKHPKAFSRTRLRAALDRFVGCQMMAREGDRCLAVALSDWLADLEAPPEGRDWLAIVT